MSVFVGEYPQEWKHIADRVKSLAGGRCVRCGHRHSTPTRPRRCDDGCDASRHSGGLNDGKQRVLTVHHLDGDKSNCVWWNLAPLCQVCHLIIQAKVNMARPWEMLPHSRWFLPYVAGYYAFVAGLTEHEDRNAIEANLNYYVSLGNRHGVGLWTS